MYIYAYKNKSEKIDYSVVLNAYMQLNTFCDAVVAWEPIHKHDFPEAALACGELSQRLHLTSQETLLI